MPFSAIAAGSRLRAAAQPGPDAMAEGRLASLVRHLSDKPAHRAVAAGTTVGRKGPFQLGIIGLGAIGKDMLQLCIDDPVLAAELHVPSVLVRRPRSEVTPGGTLITSDAGAFFAHRFDAVLEVAGHATVVDYGARVLEGGADFIVTSVGAFSADDTLLNDLRDAALRGAARLVIASAGIGGLDILTGAAVGGLSRVQMVVPSPGLFVATVSLSISKRSNLPLIVVLGPGSDLDAHAPEQVRKDPSAWTETIAEELFDLNSITTDPVTIFEGTAREGAKLYPQNVNISAAVALAGIGLDKTELVIVADPTIDTHVCEVSAWGEFGSFTFTEDVAISEHRKTGKIVAMAVAKTVKHLVSPVVIGH